MSATIERTARSIRFPVKDLEQIDQRARSYGLDRTHFLIDAALERLPDTRNTLQARIEQLEADVQRLQEALYNAT